MIYASGAEHPLKRPCAQIIQAIALDRSQCWSSAEVLQELLYVLSRRLHWQRTREAVTGVAMLLSDHIVPVDRHHILWCLEEEPVPALQARDRVHLAVMHRLGITRIVSTDSAFDAVTGVSRLDPLNLGSWRDSVFRPSGPAIAPP